MLLKCKWLFKRKILKSNNFGTYLKRKLFDHQVQFASNQNANAILLAMDFSICATNFIFLNLKKKLF